MRAGGDLVEQDRSIGQYEQLHAEHAPSGFARCRGLVDQPLHRGTGDGTRPFQHLAIGRRGLPGFPVVTAFLPLPDRRARDHAGRRAHRQHRQLIIQRRQRLDDHARHVALVGGAPTLLRLDPCGVDRVRPAHDRLPMPGRAHHRLDHARVPDLPRPGAQLLQRPGETVRRGRQPQILVREHAQPLAVHADGGDFGARHHLDAARRGIRQLAGRDRLDLRHDDVGAHLVEQRAQPGRVGHIQHACLVRHLLGGRTGVRVGRAHPCAETHQLDGDLLAELTRAEEQHAGGMCPQRRAQRAMGGKGTCKSAGFSHGLIVPPGGYRISMFRRRVLM